MAVDEYRHFVAAFECRNFSEAGRMMNMSAQGVGKSVKTLEAHLGVSLFRRTSQGLIPTRVAFELYEHCKNIITEEEGIADLIAKSSESAKKVYVLGRDSRVGDAIAEGLRTYSASTGVEIEMLFKRESEDEQAEKFECGHYDYRIATEELNTFAQYPHERLCVLEYVFVVNSECSLASKGTICIEDLRGRTILVHNPFYASFKILQNMCNDCGFDPEFRKVDKGFIWELMSRSDEYVHIIRRYEARTFPWVSSMYATLDLNPSLQAHIMLQTQHENVDPVMLEHIKASLAIHCS